jgi:RHS repeat-associated protein
MKDAFRFWFSSKYTDDKTGLVYYGYRYYAPGLGRWTSRDPIEEEGGLNLNAFCSNNSIGFVDVLGNDYWIQPGYPIIRMPPIPIPRPRFRFPTARGLVSAIFAWVGAYVNDLMNQCANPSPGSCRTSGECIDCCGNTAVAAQAAYAAAAGLAYTECLGTGRGVIACWPLVLDTHRRALNDLRADQQRCLNRECSRLPLVPPPCCNGEGVHVPRILPPLGPGWGYFD